MLDSYRVLDLCDYQGAFCGKMLAEMGADVIRIEKPGGDLCRNIGPFYKDVPDAEKSLYWFTFNRDKRGITLNLESREGKEIFQRLAKTADFVIESFPPGYLDSLSLGYTALSELKPSIIMTSITPFGQEGPCKDYKGSDLVESAMGGFVYVHGEPSLPPVRFSAVDLAYLEAGSQAAAGTMLAHYYRLRTGEGQRVDVSAQEAMTNVLWITQHHWGGSKTILKRTGQFLYRVNILQRYIWSCKDGYITWRIWVADQGARTTPLVKWMAEEGMAGDLVNIDWEQLSMTKLTQEQIEPWEKIFGAFFLTKTTDELYQESLKRNFTLFPSHSIDNLLNDEQLKAREFWVEIEHPELGVSLTYPGAPIRLDKTPWLIRRRAPLIGEHNIEVYHDELGYSHEELALLKANGVI